MEENEKISVESLISNQTNTLKSNWRNSEGGNTSDYCDFEYNVDEILDSRNWVYKNELNLSLNNYKSKNIVSDYFNYFKDNENLEIRRINTTNLNNKSKIKNLNSLDYSGLFNTIKSKSNNNISLKNLLIIRKPLIKIKTDNIQQINNNIDKSLKKVKSLDSKIISDKEIEEYLNQDNKIKKFIKDDKNNKVNQNNNKINKEKKSDIKEQNYTLSFTNFINEIEKEIKEIKKKNFQKNFKIFEKNKKLVEILFKLNNINNIISHEDEKYKVIFRQILSKINYYLENKNNFEIINLFTEIKEYQNINISLKNQYKKLMNNKPYKEKSIINERKLTDYKKNLKYYNELINKISKMETTLNNLNKILEENKFNLNDKNNSKEFEEEKDQNKLKETLSIYENTIKMLNKEIIEKEKELNYLKENIN